MKQSDCGFSGRQGAAGSPARPNRTDRGQGGSNGLCVYFQVCVCVREKDEGGECPVKLNVASWFLNELALAVTATLSDLPAGTSLSHLGCQWMAVNPTLPWTLAFNKPIHAFNKGPVRRVHVVTCYLTSASYPGVCDNLCPICFVAVQNVRVFFLVPFSWLSVCDRVCWVLPFTWANAQTPLLLWKLSVQCIVTITPVYPTNPFRWHFISNSTQRSCNNR